MMKKTVTTLLIQMFCACALLCGVQHIASAKKLQIRGVININKASQEQLKLLPRVGPKMSKRIIAFRKKTPFKRIEDIMKVRGIGKKTFKKMKSYITVKSTTSVQPAKPSRPQKVAKVSNKK